VRKLKEEETVSHQGVDNILSRERRGKEREERKPQLFKASLGYTEFKSRKEKTNRGREGGRERKEGRSTV
jgi:hypothetical protein